MLVAALLGGVYLAWEPPSADLAAQAFRTELFEQAGFAVWSNAWYAGHHLPAYSLLYPSLASLLGVRLVGVLSAVAAAGLFATLAHERYGRRAWLGALWFAAATATSLFTGRLTFALGVALGLGALVALQRGRRGLAVVLAALTCLASPVAGLFLALAGVAVAVGARRDPAAESGAWRGGAATALAAIAALVTLGLAFPIGGVEPFAVSAFQNVPIFAAAALVLIPAEERVLRWGVALYALAAVALFAFDNAVGGNFTRLGALFGGPALALVLAGRRPLALALVALPLVWWQWSAPVRDLSDALGDPSVEAAFHAPLIDQLDRRVAGAPVRVHVTPSRNRWEAVHVARAYPLARGWLRQAESDDFELFQDGRLTPHAYRDWLHDAGVSYVAMPLDVELDYLAEDEAELIEEGLPYLELVWESEDWRLYRVAGRPSLLTDLERAASSRARVTALDAESFELTARAAGGYLVRVHHTPYWEVVSGDACVERSGEWTRARVRSASRIRVEARFGLEALLGRDRDCPGG